MDEASEIQRERAETIASDDERKGTTGNAQEDSDAEVRLAEATISGRCDADLWKPV